LKRRNLEGIDKREAVRLDNPLKQGLKHVRDRGAAALLRVRLDNPLKQGLKPQQDIVCH